MPISIKNKKNCTGCSACASICPQQCISLEKDEQWFDYPVIDYDKCTNCNLCTKVCPVNNFCKKSVDKTVVYAAWSKNENTRFTSTSGGAFSEFAEGILDRGGFVVGAAYKADNMVEHIIIESKDEIKDIRQSKYIQSDINNVFIRIRKKLVEGKIVLFCGAPCQVAGLKNYLKEDYETLYTIDFICRGMNSPKAYRFWLEEIESEHNSKVSKIWFKYKENGWKKSPYCTRIEFENGQNYIAFADENYFMKGYLQGNLYLRPSCSQCQFKGVGRNSDITLADFWKIPDSLDDDKGTSMILINSDKGRLLFEDIKNNLIFHERSFDEIYEGNVCFSDSVKLNPKGERFLKELGTKKFSVLVEEYTRISFVKKCLRKIKRLLKGLNYKKGIF